MNLRSLFPILLVSSIALVSASCGKSNKTAGPARELLNVSYDPTREFYGEFNKLFAEHWNAKTGIQPTINQSHGGSGKQSRSVLDGLEADVVTLALAADVDALATNGNLLDKDWQKQLPDNSAPYTSTIVLVVRKGNPQGIKDWGDLVRDGVKVITPNPKTSGGARWNYLAAWAFASKQFNGDEVQVKAFMTKLFKNVPVLDTGARGSTATFAQRNLGDVLLSWENEAYLIAKEFPGATEIIYPSISILAEPPVAVVKKNAERHGSSELAKAYLEYLYTPEAQELVGRHFYRPRNKEIAAKFESTLRNIPLVTIDKDFGGWAKAQETHFADGGTFDQVSAK